MDIIKATKAYEAWLRQRILVLPLDLGLKHLRMAQSPFTFLRATFYRWAQLWPRFCPELSSAPAVLAVGDLHVENFGTWRDSDGRLVWGINDFDEAASMAYTNDLVRLAASAILAIRESHLFCDESDACGAILTGYQEGLEAGGAPFVLAEEHRGLREWAASEMREPRAFWEKLVKLPTVRGAVPAEVTAALKRTFPEAGLRNRVVHRQAGLGSLGRRRFTALAQWRGAWIAREAKELVESAWHWECGGKSGGQILYQRIIHRAVRVPDPFHWASGHWVIRRIAPDCGRIELAALPKARDELKLLKAMGWESANVHLGTREAKRLVLADLRRRPKNWLRKASGAMAEATVEDWKHWNKAVAESRRAV